VKRNITPPIITFRRLLKVEKLRKISVGPTAIIDAKYILVDPFMLRLK
jgi:hypothetical protein